MFWLDDRRGDLGDWATQQWVRATGKTVDLKDHDWLKGPTGNTRIIGKQFFLDYARQRGLEIVRDGHRGLIQDFQNLELSPNAADAGISDFYERTSEYDLDAWAEWRGFFKPFGTALAVLFSRRLQQLNVPLSSLDTSHGMTSEVLQLRDPVSGEVQTAWIRQLVKTQNVIYAGSYSICSIPGYSKPCIKVVFPLPNGRAIVIMRPEVHSDGSFSVISAGERFGDPGFYFVVQRGETSAYARYVRSLQESIRVYASGGSGVRADHILKLWGREFLRLHYRLSKSVNLPLQTISASALA